MIVVTKIEVTDVEGNHFELAHYPKMEFDPRLVTQPAIDQTFEREIIEGEAFYDSEGRIHLIGLSREVRTVLKIPLKAYGSILAELQLEKNRKSQVEYKLKAVQDKNLALENELNKVHTLGFFGRATEHFIFFLDAVLLKIDRKHKLAVSNSFTRGSKDGRLRALQDIKMEDKI